MNNKQIEEKLKNAVSHATPDVLDNILSQCNNEKGTVIDMTQMFEDKSKKSSHKRTAIAFGAAAAAIALFATGIFAGSRFSYLTNAVDSIVEIDVNPSVQLQINRKEKVLEATALNDDATQILDGMDLEGAQLNVAVNALIGSMLRHGYIDELANSVLISVENDDTARGEALSQRLTQEVTQLLEENAVQGAVLAQAISTKQPTQLTQAASESQISSGKAVLIQKILDTKPLLTFEDLSGLSINDLNLLLSTIQQETADTVNVVSSGNASDKAYIGTENALTIAYEHSGVDSANVTVLESGLDWDDGRMVYELEFVSGNIKYEYDIDALSGDVRKSERENSPSSNVSQSTTVPNTSTDLSGTDWIDQQTAKEIAFADAGVSQQDVQKLELDFDYENGQGIYEIEFICNGTEYEYDIHAKTGEILKAEKDQKTSSGSTVSDSAPTSAITAEQAQQIALEHAGVSASQASRMQVEYDVDDGVAHYSVDFYYNGTEYDYEIHAQTGEILKQEKEQKAAPTTSTTSSIAQTVSSSSSTTTSNQSSITSQQAQQIALEHAGASASQASRMQVEYDVDDGVPHYSVEFYFDGAEYEYEIHARTGEILKQEKEQKTVSAQTTSGSTISAAKAQEIALNHAGFSASQVRELEVDYDMDDRIPHYTVEFKNSGIDYEYEIDAATGEILKVEKD